MITKFDVINWKILLKKVSPTKTASFTLVPLSLVGENFLNPPHECTYIFYIRVCYIITCVTGGGIMYSGCAGGGGGVAKNGSERKCLILSRFYPQFHFITRPEMFSDSR